MNEKRQDRMMRLMSNGSPFKAFLGELAEKFCILTNIPLVPSNICRTPASASSTAASSGTVRLTRNMYDEFMGKMGSDVRYVFEKFTQNEVGNAIRLSSGDHKPMVTSTARTCIMCSAKNKTSQKQRPTRTNKQCSICKVHLCGECFHAFHTDQITPSRHLKRTNDSDDDSRSRRSRRNLHDDDLTRRLFDS